LDEDGGRSVEYTYDAAYRLTQEAITDPVRGNSTILYTYDAAGNRLTKTDPGGLTTYAYDANDRLLTATSPGAAFTYGYDANGNLLQVSDGVNTTSYTYDGENRLSAVENGSNLAAYRYDLGGDRVESDWNGTITRYTVDKTGSYSQVVAESAPDGSLLAGYVYGEDLISQKRGGSRYFHHYDGHGSTRRLTDAGEAVTDEYVYDAFGVLTASTGSSGNNYLYAGEQFDPPSGYYYLRARYYDQGSGRFLSHDPLLGDLYAPFTLHRYLYARNDPVNYLDPGGENIVAYTVALGVFSALVNSAYFYAVNTFFERQRRDIPNDLCWGKDAADAWIREFDKEHQRFFTSSLIRGSGEELELFFLPLQTRARCCSLEVQTNVYCQGLGVLPFRESCIVTCVSTEYYTEFISVKRYFPWRNDVNDPASTTAECW
jgi:RHS repeat-associated protein